MSRMSGDQRKRASIDDRGGALIEGALALPLFLIFFLGIVGWNLFMFQEVVVQYASVASARCKTMPNGPHGEDPYCGTFQTFGVQNALGLVSDPQVFQAGAPTSFPYSGGTFSVACVLANAGNPLSFLPFISMPTSNYGSFCRPRL